MSYCACEDGSLLFDKCGFVCTSLTSNPTHYPTSLPTKPTPSPTFPDNDTFSTTNDGSSDEPSQLAQLDGIWIHLYSTLIESPITPSPTIAPTKYNSSDTNDTDNFSNSESTASKIIENMCDISATGTVASIVSIMNTNGSCQSLPASQQLIGTGVYNYYSLDLASESVSLFCKEPTSTINDSCTECKYSTDSIKLGNCSLLDTGDARYNMMLLGYYSNITGNNNTDVDVHTDMDIDYTYQSPCIGGNYNGNADNNVISVLYNKTSLCDSNYVFLQNLGPYDKCNLYKSKANLNGSLDEYYSSLQLTKGTDNQTNAATNATAKKTTQKPIKSYTLLLQCSEKNIAKNSNKTLSICSTDHCSTSFENVQHDTCHALDATTFSYKIVFGDDLRICGLKYRNKDKKRDDEANIGLILGVIFGVIGLIIVCVICWIFRMKLKDVFGWMSQTVIQWCSKWCTYLFFVVYDCFGPVCFNPLPPMEVWQAIACLIASGILMIQGELWQKHNPWAVFNIESFEKLGIDANYLDIDKLNSMFDEWTQLGNNMTRIFWIVLLILFFARLFLVKPVSYQTWTLIRIIIFCLYLISQFALFIVPSLFYDFKSSIKLNSDSLEDNSLVSDEMIENINEFLGGSFAGIFVTYLSNILLYWMHAIPSAGYCMTVVYVLRQLHPEEEVHRVLTEHQNKMSQGDSDEKQLGSNVCSVSHACKYDLNESFKIAILCRLSVMVFIVQVLNSSIEALPVIILYQSFGVSYSWITVWFSWWVIPILLLIHFGYITRRYIDILMHPRRYYFPNWKPSGNRKQTIDTTQTEITVGGKKRKKSKAWSMKMFRLHLGVNVFIYFSIFWIGSIWAFEIERSFVPSLDLTFLFWNVFGTFIITLLLVFSLLHSMFVKYDKSSLHVNTNINIDSNTKRDHNENKNKDGHGINAIDKAAEHGVKRATGNEQEMSEIVALTALPSKDHESNSKPPPRRKPPTVRLQVSNVIPQQSQRQQRAQRPPRGHNITTRTNPAGAHAQRSQPQPVLSLSKIGTTVAGDDRKEVEAKSVSERIAEVPTTSDQVKKNYKNISENNCCFVFCLVNHWVFEKTERSFHDIFGKRVAKRRFFLIVGGTANLYANINLLHDVLNITVKEYVINVLNDLDIGVTWPDDENGGTIFDDAFDVYEDARYSETIFSWIALICFIISIYFDWCLRGPRGLFYSRIFGWIAIVFLFIAAISTALPNYVTGTHIDEIMPSCAPDFDEALDLITGNLIGILCSTMFCVTMLPMLVALTPSVVRACVLVLKESNRYQLQSYEMETLRYLIVLTSVLNPLMTFLPLLVFQQLFGDKVTATCLCCFWILPAVMGFVFNLQYIRQIDKNTDDCCCSFVCCECDKKECLYKVLFMSWMMCYFGPLFVIVVYQFSLYGVPNYVVSLFTDADFYMSVFAEGFLANVVLSDFIYASLLTVDWNNLETDN